MSSHFINGAKYAFSTALAQAVAITGISNAFPAIASAATLPAAGDVVLLQSNWSELNELATYARNPGAGSFTLAGVDTTDTGLYFPTESTPANYRVASAFVSLSQIRGIEQSGGDANAFNFSYIDDRGTRQRSKPTDDNPLSLVFTMDEDSTLPWFEALRIVSRKRQLVTMRERLPEGDVLLYTGYMSFNPSPSRTRNENRTVRATMSVNSEILRFPASDFAGS